MVVKIIVREWNAFNKLDHNFDLQESCSREAFKGICGSSIRKWNVAIEHYFIAAFWKTLIVTLLLGGTRAIIVPFELEMEVNGEDINNRKKNLLQNMRIINQKQREDHPFGNIEIRMTRAKISCITRRENLQF